MFPVTREMGAEDRGQDRGWAEGCGSGSDRIPCATSCVWGGSDHDGRLSRHEALTGFSAPHANGQTKLVSSAF